MVKYEDPTMKIIKIKTDDVLTSSGYIPPVEQGIDGNDQSSIDLASFF